MLRLDIEYPGVLNVYEMSQWESENFVDSTSLMFE